MWSIHAQNVFIMPIYLLFFFMRNIILIKIEIINNYKKIYFASRPQKQIHLTNVNCSYFFIKHAIDSLQINFKMCLIIM